MNSPLSCFATNSLSVWQITSSGLRVAAVSSADIMALYSAWLFVHVPIYWEFMVKTLPCSERIRNAVAAGPGFPLAPPSEKIIKRLGVLFASFLGFAGVFECVVVF